MKVAGIILAAGQARRFGATKQLYDWTAPDGQSRPLVQHVAEIALGSRLNNVIVVLGHDCERVENALLPLRGQSRLATCINPNYQEGQSTSVRAGLASLEAGADGTMFLLCDQPLITSRLINDLIDRCQETRALICAPVVNGKRGNPVIFDRTLFRELAELTGDQGGRALFEKYRSQTTFLEVEDEIMFQDLDEPPLN